MHGVQVINLRGSYLKQLFRDPVLKLWRAGVNMRMSEDNQESPDLTYIKLCPQILNLAFFHALQQATARGGEAWAAVAERMRDRLSRLQKADRSEQLVAHVRNFLGRWSVRMGDAAAGQPVAATSSDKDGPAPSVEWVDRSEKAAPRIAHHIKAWYGSAREPFVAVLLVGYESQAIVGLVKALRNRLQDADLAAEFFDNGRLIERGKVSIAEVPSVKSHVVVSVSPSACALLDSGDPRAIHIRNQLYVA